MTPSCRSHYLHGTFTHRNSFYTHLVGKMGDDVVRVVVVLVHGQPEVALVVQDNVRNGVCDQHIATYVKLTTFYQQWVDDVAEDITRLLVT